MAKLIFSMEPVTTSDKSIKGLCLVADNQSPAIVFTDDESNMVQSVEISIPDAIQMAKIIINFYG